MFGSKVKVLLQDIDLIKWDQDLRSDRDKLERLLGTLAFGKDNSGA